MRAMLLRAFFVLVLLGVLPRFSLAATLCVNPGGTSGCYATLSAAVSAAAAHDTIKVASGIYAEDVQIGKSLSLIGENPSNTAPLGVFANTIRLMEERLTLELQSPQPQRA